MPRAQTDVPIKSQPGTVISAVPAQQCKHAASTHPLSLPLPMSLPLALSLSLPLSLPMPLSMQQATGYRPQATGQPVAEKTSTSNMKHKAT